MDEKKRTHSLRWQMGAIILLCWLIPVLMVLAAMVSYVSDSLGQRAREDLASQLELNLRMSGDRLDTAVAASRTASSDRTIKDAWDAYARNGLYTSLSVSTRGFLDRQYRTDGRFRFAVFYFSEAPEELYTFTYNQGLGYIYSDVYRCMEADHEAVFALADTLDTSIGFLASGGQLYLVRNVMDSGYARIGTLVLALHTPYFFENLAALPWAWSAEVEVGGAALCVREGEGAPPSRLRLPLVRVEEALELRAERDSYALSAALRVDYSALLGRFTGYLHLLLGMLLLIPPLLAFTFFFLRRRVSRPVERLVAGALQVERGELGHRIAPETGSTEFSYLAESFNRMSGQLRGQFDRLYQEELALRDARIKALQSHINPHFLNNTLEIINWEARMNGDVKVSKMIEALATLLDAAVDREKRPEVPLREELGYVNAYLYIIDQRFGRRLGVTQEIAPETLDELVPRLILQPVIENAVEHGIGPGGHGEVCIRSRRTPEALELEITNDGGLTPADEARIARLLAPDYEAGAGERAGNLGIANVHARLRILYGGGSGLTITAGEGRLVVARLRIERRQNDGGTGR